MTKHTATFERDDHLITVESLGYTVPPSYDPHAAHDATGYIFRAECTCGATWERLDQWEVERTALTHYGLPPDSELEATGGDGPQLVASVGAMSMSAWDR